MDGALQRGKEPPKSNSGAQHLSHHPFPVPCSFSLHPSKLPTGAGAVPGGMDRWTGLSLQPLREPS